MRPYLTRLRALDPTVTDRVAAAGLACTCVIELFIVGDGSAESIAGVLIAAAGLLTLAVRRARPFVPLVVVPLTAALGGLLASFVVNSMAAPFVGMFLAMYSAGRYADPVVSRIVAPAVWLAIGIASMAADEFRDPAQLLWLTILGLGPYVVGRIFLSRARLQNELRARTAELERDREASAENAVEAERSRIAAELQAAVANGVSAMVVQAEAVPRVLRSGRIADAEASLTVIEETGRDSLAEMRRLLGVLRRDSDGPSLAPQPTMAEVERLAERIRERGLEVELDFEGERIPLGPGADLAAYRVLQDALAAAADTGASRADVVVGFDPGEVRLDVRDDRGDVRVDPEPLLAMRERLGLYGGRVKAEALAEGGFRVVAKVPVNGAMA